MSEEIPLTPVGRDQIHKLESALLIASIFSPTVLEELENPKERLTWIDSLAVAAAALAREKAKMSVSQIADELGRSEATIRNHLQGKTKAGQIVRETYERFVREGVSIPSLPELFNENYAPITEKEDVEKLKSEIESLKSQLEQYKSKVEEYEKKLSDAKTVLSSVAETINRLISEI